MFENFKNAWDNLFTTPLGEMTGIHLILFVVICILGFLLIRWIAKYIRRAFIFFFRGTKRSLSARERCKHYVCSNCGKTLDKCNCGKYRDLSYGARIRHYKREHKND